MATGDEQLGSLRFLNTNAVQTKAATGAVGGTGRYDLYSKGAGARSSKGFNSTTKRFTPKDPGPNVGPASYHPAAKVDTSHLSTSVKGTGAFVKGRSRVKRSATANVGPGSHNIAKPIYLKEDHSHGDAAANYAKQVSSRHAVYDPRTRVYVQQAAEARGVYAPSKKFATPGPNAYNTAQDVKTTRTRIVGVFSSKTKRPAPSSMLVNKPELVPGPGDYNTGGFADRVRQDSKASAAMRCKSERFKQGKPTAPPPGAYDPMVSQTKTRAPYGKQNHRELVPHFKQQFTMRHPPPAKAKQPGPANYNLSPMDGPKFTGNSPMFRSRSHRTQMDQELSRMQRIKANPGPGAYGRSISESHMSKASHHYNPANKWI